MRMDETESHKKQAGSAPLVLGILSIVFGILTGVIGFILGIVGIVKSKRALLENPGNTNARNGRTCSALGIAVSCIQIVAAIILSIVLGIGFGQFTEDQGAARRAATQTLEQTTNPPAKERTAISSAIDRAFETKAGIPLNSLGVSKDELINWLFNGAASKITNVSVKTAESDGATITTATVTATITSNNLSDLAQTIQKKLAASNAAPGQTQQDNSKVVKEAMNETPPRTRETSFVMTKRDGKWRVDDAEVDALAYDMYIG
jgi:hypothetical protein